ncbi:MAG: bifunctional glutamate N-acetyltransferase/amino-acid acetyltransferase ArgJ [Proteobacteria bacterium]|nr:bifunctional glutamate N-acetyltransferase/amino-acid acetyltransferase ArgJ [Pseudomonadota bacterium]
MNEKTKLPDGFLCSGIVAGLKQEPKKDLGLIYTTKNAVLGGVFTRNKFPSAHVQYCRTLTPTNEFRALVVNSGNANAATGQTGVEANQRMASQLAELLKVSSHQVFTSSTGIIGRPFPLRKIEDSLEMLVSRLVDHTETVAEAIMTTDTKPKTASVEIGIDQEKYTVTGFAKGSGMIHPNMGTMLAYVLTDAPLPYSGIQELTRDIADLSFNCVSVDGDTSTNDSFYLISSNPVDELQPSLSDKIREAIRDVSISLARQIAGDGEGAKHLIEVVVRQAPSKETARRVQNAVVTSNLVKTAVHGRDPNWGRIMMAAGNGLLSDDAVDNHPISISIQGVSVFSEGEPQSFDEEELSRLMAQFDVRIEVDLHNGNESTIGWGCDFSDEYIRINADYST